MKTRADSLRQAGYAVLRGEREWIERVIERAIAEDGSIFHAAWLDALDHMDDMPTCSICGGRLPGLTNPHELCKARVAFGQPIVRMDYTPECGCTPCTIARKTS